LAVLTGTTPWGDEAERSLRSLRGVIERSPMASGQMLLALDFYLGPVQEVAIVGDRTGADVRRVLRAARAPFRPRRLVALRDAAESSTLPLLADKSAHGPVTTYICQNYACQAPIVGAEEAEKELATDG
jgi:uncharacterized protein YyaL (SSP411 family)